MQAAAIAARRHVLGSPSTTVVRANAALGYSLVVLTGVGLGLWLIIGLVSLLPTAAAG